MAYGNVSGTVHGGAPDPYTQALQRALGTAQAGFTGPTEMSYTQQRLSPEEEQAAYSTGYAGLPGQVEQAWAPTQAAGFGQLPEGDISRFLGLAEGPQREGARENINAALAEAGFAPGGKGAAPVGPQAELMGRFESALRGQQAQSFYENAMQGARTRAQGAFGRAGAMTGAASNIAASRYRTLTQPNILQMRGKGAGGGQREFGGFQQQGFRGPGGGGGGFQQRPDWYSGMPSTQSEASINWNAMQPSPYTSAMSGYAPVANPYTAGTQESGWWGDEYARQTARKPQGGYASVPPYQGGFD